MTHLLLYEKGRLEWDPRPDEAGTANSFPWIVSSFYRIPFAILTAFDAPRSPTVDKSRSNADFHTDASFFYLIDAMVRFPVSVRPSPFPSIGPILGISGNAAFPVTHTVQAFFAERAWRMSGKNMILAAVLIILL